MLSAVRLAGLFAAPIATIALFLRPPFRGRAVGPWPWTRCLLLALASTAVLAAVVAGLLAVVGATPSTVVGGAVGLVVVSVLYRAPGHLRRRRTGRDRCHVSTGRGCVLVRIGQRPVNARVRPFVVLVLLAALMTACSGGSHGGPVTPAHGGSAPGRSAHRATSSGAPTMTSQQAFLSEYVASDGRVIRRDQGGDVVSEGQAYGMLIAEVTDRPNLARTIWSWTERHLRGKHGLVASRATGSGQVQDTNSAADADVLLAYALLRYTGPDRAQLHAAGKLMAETVLAVESVTVSGAPVLLAGPWAKSPDRVDPSYWMPGIFRAIAHYTGDRRWIRAADEALRLLDQVTDSGKQLPPDWAELSSGRLRPIAAPSGGAPIQYGLDAQRLPLWLATGCTVPVRDLAARWWSILSVDDRAGRLALSLTGGTINGSSHPLPLVAAAAAAVAGGDEDAAGRLRVRAAEVENAHRSYYGAAWLALTGALLDHRLDPCSDAGI